MTIKTRQMSVQHCSVLLDMTLKMTLSKAMLCIIANPNKSSSYHYRIYYTKYKDTQMIFTFLTCCQNEPWTDSGI